MNEYTVVMRGARTDTVSVLASTPEWAAAKALYSLAESGNITSAAMLQVRFSGSPVQQLSRAVGHQLDWLREQEDTIPESEGLQDDFGVVIEEVRELASGLTRRA